MAYNLRKNRFIFAAATAGMLAACGGGSGDGGTETSTDTPSPTTSLTTLSGQVELVNNTTQTLSLGESFMRYFLPRAHAAIVGLVDAPAGTSVRLVRIDASGAVVETFESVQTQADGRFELQASVDLDFNRADLLIEAGPSDDPVRAPAAGQEIVVNPVSLSIVNKVIAQVQSGESQFSDFRASDLANAIGIVIAELDARAEDVVFATSNVAAAAQADTIAGTVDDDFVANAANPPALATGTPGAKNVAILNVAFELLGPETNLTASNESFVVDLTTDRRIELAERPIDTTALERRWRIEEINEITGELALNTDDGTLFFPFSTAPSEDDEDAFDVTITSDGRLFGLNGALSGAISDDGAVFFMTERRDEGPATQGQALISGASQWNPGDVSMGFNFVKFEAYVDVGLTGEQWGYTTTLRGDADLACVAGNCTLALDRFSGALGTERKIFAQAGPDGQLLTGSSPNDGLLTLSGITLDDTGRLGGSASVSADIEFGTRGFVGPDGRLLVVQIADDQSNFPFQDLVIGLPKGTSCDATTFDGRYNMVALGGSLSEGSDTNTVFDATFDLESETLVVEADGAGTLTVRESMIRGVQLQFNDLNTNLTTDLSVGVDEPGIPYSISDECRITIADEAGERMLGAVSPDGAIAMFTSYEQITDSAGAASTFQSILLGLRQPEPL